MTSTTRRRARSCGERERGSIWRWRALAAIGRAVVLCLASLVASQASPRIQLSQAVWDFGALTNRQELSHQIIIHNSGDAPLEVSRVESSCEACLTANLPERLIPPNESRVVSCHLDLRRLAGEVTRTLTFHSNDPERPGTVVTVTGRVVPLFDVTPPEVLLDLGAGPESAVAQILPLGRMRAPLSRVLLDNTNMTAQLTKFSAEGYSLTLQASATLPPGRTRFHVSIASVDPADPVCAVDGLVINPGEIELIPPALQFRPEPGPQSRIVWVRQTGAHPMTLVDVVLPSDKFRATVEPDASGVNYRLDIVAWDQQTSSATNGQLQLKLRDASNRERLLSAPITIVRSEPTKP